MPYDGSTDPLDHLEGYKALKILEDASDALLSLAFLATLRKVVRVGSMASNQAISAPLSSLGGNSLHTLAIIDLS